MKKKSKQGKRKRRKRRRRRRRSKRRRMRKRRRRVKVSLCSHYFFSIPSFGGLAVLVKKQAFRLILINTFVAA